MEFTLEFRKRDKDQNNDELDYGGEEVFGVIDDVNGITRLKLGKYDFGYDMFEQEMWKQIQDALQSKKNEKCL